MKNINQLIRKIMLHENKKETAFQVAVFTGFLFCLFLWEPVSMYFIFGAIESGEVQRVICAVFAAIVFLVLFIGIQYINNTYGDMNTWKIIINVRERFFRIYFNTNYYKMHTVFREGEIFDRIYNSGMGIVNYFVNYAMIIIFIVISIFGACYYLQFVSFIFLPIIVFVPLELYLAHIIADKIEGMEQRLRKLESIRAEDGERLIENLEFSIMYHVEENMLEDYLYLIRESRKQQQKKEVWQESIQSIHIFSQSCMRIILEREIKYRAVSMADSLTLVLALEKLTEAFKEMISHLLEVRQKKIMVSRVFELEEYTNSHILNNQRMEEEIVDAIILNHVTVHQKNVDILRDVNLSIKYGEKVALIGENGSGKSTLLKVILGLLPATSGICLMGGSDAEICDGAECKRISYLPVETNLFSETVKDNLDMGNEKEDKVLWEQVLEQCMTFQDRTVENLSGGQQQLVNIGRGIYRNGEILIADEPTSHLSEEKAQDIMSWIIRSSNTCLVVTHDYALLPLFTRVFRIEKGMLREI